MFEEGIPTHPCGLRLAACGFGLLSGWAQADVILIGAPERRSRDAVEISIAAEARTVLDFMSSPHNTSFDKVLRFDYRGTGDSFSEIGKVAVSDCLEDIAPAVREGCLPDRLRHPG